jgi:periplasmic divalent cation tolerance protein
MSSENPEALLVLTTCPDEGTAERISRGLVEAGLAACVSRMPGLRSTYRWQGRVEDEPEVLLLIKTVATRFQELEMRLKSLHPYEVPEIIALPIAMGSSDYLSWLRTALS